MHPYRQFVSKYLRQGEDFRQIAARWKQHKLKNPHLFPPKRKYTRKKPYQPPKAPCRDARGRFSRPPNCVKPRKRAGQLSIEELRKMNAKLKKKMRG